MGRITRGASRTTNAMEEEIRYTDMRDSDTSCASQITETAHFANDLGLDSLDTVEVVMAIEEVCYSPFPLSVSRSCPP